jgi:hypothetical protein
VLDKKAPLKFIGMARGYDAVYKKVSDYLYLERIRKMKTGHHGPNKGHHHNVS